MKETSPCMKAPLKGELLRRMAQRYPEMEMGTVEIVSHIQSISRSLSARMSADLAGYGLTEGKFYLLCFLFSEELLAHADPSPSEIADSLGVTRGTVTGLLDGLERDDYLERFHHSRDRRALTIRMTEKARTFMDGFLHEGTKSLTEALPLEDEEKRTLIACLSRIEQVLGRPRI